MEVSILLAEQIFIMLLMGILGFIIVKVGMLTVEDSKVLSKICVYVCVPCTILNSFQIERTPDMMSGLMIAAIVSISYHILYIGFCRIFKNIWHLTAVERASIIYTNVGCLIVPLVTFVFGAEWIVYVCIYMVVQTVLVWTHGTALLRHNGERTDWKKIFGNINMIAIFVGLVLFFTQIQLFGVLGSVVERVADMLGPLSMLVVGMIMGGADLATVFRNKRVYFICFIRLIVCPLLSLLFALFCGLGKYHPDAHTILEVLLLAGASSAAATITQMAQVFGEDSQYASIINVMSVLLCLVTMPILTFLFEVLAVF